MPLRSYGVLVGRAIDSRREAATSDTPHYQIHVKDEDDVDYRIAVNVQSQLPPSDLLYHVDDDLRHPVTTTLESLGSGWHLLPGGAGGANLDFIRGNLFDPAQMRPLPPDAPGADNDLSDHLDHYVQRGINDPAAQLYVYGERWGPEGTTRDKVFGFRPGNGVLRGWRLADRLKNTCEIPPGPLAAGATVTVPVSNGVALGNRGGSITVLDDTGRKVSGVSYTAETAQHEGWMITF